MEIGFGNGDSLQGDSVGIHGWGETGKDCGMCSTRLVRQPLPHQRLRPRTRSLPRQLYNQPRFVSFKTYFETFKIFSAAKRCDFNRKMKKIPRYYFLRTVRYYLSLNRLCYYREKKIWKLFHQKSYEI